MPDSSCIIAAVSTWHASHEACAHEVIDRPARGETMVLAAHSLVESYSVLTRMPRGRRVSPPRALQALEQSFIRRGEVVSLDGSEYVDFLQRVSSQAVAGGQVYDALIVACALKARVDVLVTLNARHFLPFAGAALAVVVPQGG